LWLHSLKVAHLLRGAACLHTNQPRSYLNHLVHDRVLVAEPYTPAAKHHDSLEVYQSQLRNKSYGILLIVMAAELEICSLRREEYCLCARRESFTHY